MQSSTDMAQAFLEQSRRLLTGSYLPRIERAVDGLTDDQVWWRANPESNSIGNLVLHLAGNIRQWIVSGVGGAADERHRQQEFDQRDAIPAADLLSRIGATVGEADRVLAQVDPARLLEPRQVQGYDVTTFHAIYAVVEHCSMHTGQIILLAKTWKGDVGFYQVVDGKPRPTWAGGRPGN